jgi:hypothetical protein
MTWGTIGLILLGWFLVLIVARLAFGPLLQLTSRSRHREVKARQLRLPLDGEETSPGRVEGAGAAYQPLEDS